MNKQFLILRYDGSRRTWEGPFPTEENANDIISRYGYGIAVEVQGKDVRKFLDDVNERS
jgi:hypothetical protein